MTKKELLLLAKRELKDLDEFGENLKIIEFNDRVLYQKDGWFLSLQDIESGSDFWIEARAYPKNNYGIIFDHGVNFGSSIDDIVEDLWELNQQAKKITKEMETNVNN